MYVILGTRFRFYKCYTVCKNEGNKTCGCSEIYSLCRWWFMLLAFFTDLAHSPEHVILSFKNNYNYN